MSRIRPDRRRSTGVTLVELVVFIVVVAIAVGGVLGALRIANKGSPDPLIEKQALAIAESLLEEIELMPFTYCDPNDANAATAANAAGCATLPEALGPEAGESRFNTATPFDNVNDYNGYSMTGVQNIANAAAAGLGNYNASVAIVAASVGGVPATEGLQITVTVTGPANTTVVLEGYRLRYAPNALP